MQMEAQAPGIPGLPMGSTARIFWRWNALLVAL
jgi:hypothetical protein